MASIQELIQEYFEQNNIKKDFIVKEGKFAFTFTLKKEIYYSVTIKRIGNGYKVYPAYDDHDSGFIMTKEDIFDSLNHYLGDALGLHIAKKLQRKLEDTTRFSFYFKVEDIYPYSVFVSKRNIDYQHFSIRTDGDKYITDSREEYVDIEELLNALIS
jgi:hypothetical protein